MTARPILGLLGLLLAFPALAGDITGPARVINGDTIELAGERIRLYGIDAPETKQTHEWPGKTVPCGRLATTALMDLTAGIEVICKTREKDRYWRWAAVCTTPTASTSAATWSTLARRWRAGGTRRGLRGHRGQGQGGQAGPVEG